VLTPDAWRARLGEFDWVILAVPATETDGMIGAAELAAMKPSATLVNVARGSVVDQPALVAALSEKRIGAAFLDVTTPEPAAGSSAVVAAQRACHHAPFGPRAGPDVPTFRAALPG
jgi:phosphoglycerate dehydrogenase-like enzyme